MAKGRLRVIGLLVAFAVPVFVAKAILVNQWFAPGANQRGTPMDNAVSYQSLGMENPFKGQKWQLGYVLPRECGAVCQQQLHLLQQGHIELGQYQDSVEPVVFINQESDVAELYDRTFSSIEIADDFLKQVGESEYVIIDPQGHLVMRYQALSQPDELVEQNQGILTYLRKMLKVPEVG